MNTEAHNQARNPEQTPVHSDVSFEGQDIKVNSMYVYLALLGAATLIALVISIFVLRFTTKIAVSEESAPPVSREALGKDFRTLPPEPRLQGVPGHAMDPQQDLRDKLKADTEANERLGWIDEKSGIAQIPVKEAMKIVAEKGLPASSVPPAEVKK
jgi:hypothetical protein